MNVTAGELKVRVWVREKFRIAEYGESMWWSVSVRVYICVCVCVHEWRDWVTEHNPNAHSTFTIVLTRESSECVSKW